MFDVGRSASRQDQMGGDAENLNIEHRTFNAQRPMKVKDQQFLRGFCGSLDPPNPQTLVVDPACLCGEPFSFIF
jgi:hypothetical protein